MKNILIFHGTEGYPEENWFPWLKEKLEGIGYIVFVPQFPTPQNQDPDHWFAVFRDYQAHLGKDTIIVAHSGGCAFLLRLLENTPVRIKAAVFVAPPVGIMPIRYFQADRAFLEKPLNWEKIRQASSSFLIFHSEDDPFVCIGNGEKVSQELGVPLIRLKNAGHFNSKSGYTTFELLLDNLLHILDA